MKKQKANRDESGFGQIHQPLNRDRSPMPFFTASDGCRLYYTFSEPDPDFPVVVFLNGLAQTTTYWHGQAAFFSDGYRVLRYDARAQGRSETGNGPLSPEKHVADLSALFDHLGIASADLVGLSHGAYVATSYAAKHPDRVNKLIVCSLRAGRYGDSDIVERWARKLAGEGLEAFAVDVITAATGRTFQAKHANLIKMLARAVAARNSAAGLAKQLDAMRVYPPASEPAARVKAPTLVVSGGEDRIVPAGDAFILADRMKAKHQRVPEAGHSLPIEAPDSFNSLVLNFLHQSTGSHPH